MGDPHSNFLLLAALNRGLLQAETQEAPAVNPPMIGIELQNVPDAERDQWLVIQEAEVNQEYDLSAALHEFGDHAYFVVEAP